jgi:hypothetical protein
VSTAALINGACSSIPWAEQPAVTDPASPGGSTRRPTCPLGHGGGSMDGRPPPRCLRTAPRASGVRAAVLQEVRLSPGHSTNLLIVVPVGNCRRSAAESGGGRDRPLAAPIRFSILALTNSRAGSTIRSTRPGQSGKRLVPGAPPRALVSALNLPGGHDGR